MSLSNTAVPRYYGKFRDDVIMGRIPVNRKISAQMNRIDSIIANPAFYYDADVVEGWIAYCESELTLTDGADLKLLDSFKLWGEDLFGWYYYVNATKYDPDSNSFVTEDELKRLVNRQYLIVARGAAKSVYDSTIHSYELNIDRSTTYGAVIAPTIRQTEEIMSPIRTSITRSRGPLFRFLTEGSLQNTTGSKANRMKLAPTKDGIKNFITGSIVTTVPMVVDKIQGSKPNVATVDEWLSGDTREDVIGALEQGGTKLKDYMIIATSSEGTVRNGVGDSIKMELESILKGEYVNPHVSIWWYCLDDVSEVRNPAMWVKANPNIGKIVSYEAYQLDVERAEKNPAVRNDILAKRFGIPTEGYTYFFTYEETLPHSPHNFWGMSCSLGIDLSQGDDFCAFTFLFPLPGELYGIKCRSYISELTYSKLNPAMRQKYDEFIKEGTLIVMPGATLDMDKVYDDLDKHIETCRYDICAVGYDPYNAKTFIERWERENGAYGIEKVPQGARTESVPLGEIKKLMEQRMMIFDEQIMTFTMGNCITLEDTNGNRKLYKKRYEDKIDNVAAMMDAYIAFKAFPDTF